ncbi:hypothetical protein ABPG75_001267 [Micractinium tetrahymenae]
MDGTGQQQAAAPLPTLGMKTFGGVGVDYWGAVLIAAAVGTVALVYLWFVFLKWRAGRGRMTSVAAGQLRLAATRGRVQDLALLARLPDFQVDADLLGFTPLHAACVQGHPGAVVWLLQRGADLARLKQDGWRDTALHYAAGSGSMDCVQALLAWGADATLANALGALPADVAEKARHHSLAGYLRSVAAAATATAAQATAAGAADSSSSITKAAGAARGGEASGRGSTAAERERNAALQRLVQRGFEGLGTPGTVPKRETRLFRPLAVLTQFLGGAYLVWRALRTLRPGLFYLYSIPFWLAEFLAYCMSYCFVTSLFNMIERPERRVREMLPPERIPHVDVFICTYSEPVDIVEPTAVAALNMNWPGTKLTVHILDDSNRPEMARLVCRLTFQCKCMHREASIVYVARQKAAGVPHHAKAGNINSCLLKEGAKKGEFVLVLDCDMIVHPDFLERTVGHFYKMRWVPKAKVAFLQTPQDFWNVDAADPMVHCARFFYGPMLQGRDGIGAAPCCGTGVVFRRDVLVSIGGQAYGSITEDYNSAMTLMSAGMATMYLNERLSFGMAPDHIADVMTQRLRWAMGAIQILMKDNPLRLPGLTVPQSLLFFEAAAHHYLAFSTIFMALVPIVFLYSEVSPMVCAHLWEFAVVFGAWYLCNRLMMWHLHRGTEGGMQELWRGSQMWVWMAPNHVKAIWKVLVAENPIVKRLFNFEIGFLVTKKDKEQDSQWASLKKALGVTWPHLVYLAGFASGVLYFIVTTAKGWYSTWQIMIFLSAISWGMLIVLCIWPAIFTMLPRVETEAGWKICWDPFEDPAKVRAKEAATAGAPQGSRMLSFGVGSLEAGASHARRLVHKSVDFLSSRLSFHWGGAGDAGRSQRPLPPPSQQQQQEPPGASGSGMGMHQAPAGGLQDGLTPTGHAKTTGVTFTVSGEGSEHVSAGVGAHCCCPAGCREPRPSDNSDAGSAASTGVDPVRVSTSSSRASPFAAQSQQPMAEAQARAAHRSLDWTQPAQQPAHVAIRVPEGVSSAAAEAFMRGAQLSATLQGSQGLVSAYSPAVELHRRRPLSNFGRVALLSRGDTVLTSSALLTSMVLPERTSAAPDSVSVLLDAVGHVAPASDVEGATAQGRQQSHQLLPGLQGPRRLDNGPAGKRAGWACWLSSSWCFGWLAVCGAASCRPSFPLKKTRAPPTPPLSAGAQHSVTLPAEQLVALHHLTGASVELASPTVDFGTWRGGGAGSAASPFLAAPGGANVSPAEGAAAAGAAQRDTQAGGGDLSGGSSEASLVEELAGEAQQEQAQHAPAGAAPDRVSLVSRQLVDLAASLCPTNASMLLDQGYSLAVPVVPATIYEHTLVARPNFRERESPASNWMFVIVNGLLLGCLVVGSVLDVKMNKSGSDVADAMGF